MKNPVSGKRFLIIGATGNTGSLVASSLLERGETVRCLVRDAEKAAGLKQAGSELIFGDLDKPDTLAAAFHDVDSVFLVTAVGPNAEQQARNSIATAKNAGVSHFVRYSAVMPPEFEHLRSSRQHAQIESELADSGIPFTIIKPQHFMQNLLAAVPSIQSDRTIFMPYGEGRIGFVDLRDVADAVVTVMTNDGHAGKRYFITGPESISLHDAATAISGAIGETITYVDIPGETAGESFRSLGMDPWVVDEYLSYFEVFRNGTADMVTDDFEKLVGRSPRAIGDFARDYVDAFSAKEAKAVAATAPE